MAVSICQVGTNPDLMWLSQLEYFERRSADEQASLIKHAANLSYHIH